MPGQQCFRAKARRHCRNCGMMFIRRHESATSFSAVTIGYAIIVDFSRLGEHRSKPVTGQPCVPSSTDVAGCDQENGKGVTASSSISRQSRLQMILGPAERLATSGVSSGRVLRWCITRSEHAKPWAVRCANLDSDNETSSNSRFCTEHDATRGGARFSGSLLLLGNLLLCACARFPMESYLLPTKYWTNLGLNSETAWDFDSRLALTRYNGRNILFKQSGPSSA